MKGLKTIKLTEIEYLKDFIIDNKHTPIQEYAEVLYLKIYDWADSWNYKIINIHFYPKDRVNSDAIIMYTEIVLQYIAKQHKRYNKTP
jgi:hypothetical protein